MTARTHRITRDGVDLHVVDHGPVDGDPVMLLHGWPDSHRVWRHIVGPLVEDGHRVIAPDLRGYGRSDHPDFVRAYRMREVVSDLATILGTLGIPRTHLVGHDFGASAAWATAAFLPDLVASLTVLAVGHPASAGYRTLRQRQLSWYMLAFQHEDLAEAWMSADDWAGFRSMVGDHPEVDAWIADLSRPGRLTASLRWYRANMSPNRQLATDASTMSAVTVPTLGIAGSRDFALDPEQMEGSASLVNAQWRYELFDGVGHWLQLDAADRVTALLREWLAEQGPAAAQ